MLLQSNNQAKSSGAAAPQTRVPDSSAVPNGASGTQPAASSASGTSKGLVPACDKLLAGPTTALDTATAALAPDFQPSSQAFTGCVLCPR